MSIESTFQECTNWDDFRALANGLSEKRKGDSFEILSKYFLQLHPTYASQLRSVWHLNEVPSNVRKCLNLPNPDEGIDLVAHTKDGEYWAIQCKYRQDESISLTRKELSTFTDLAFNICRHISFGLVCTNTDRFSHKLALYGDRVGFCAGDIWRSLDHEFFGRVHGAIAAKSTLLEARSPFPHQRQR
jgi:predicted helicase